MAAIKGICGERVLAGERKGQVCDRNATLRVRYADDTERFVCVSHGSVYKKKIGQRNLLGQTVRSVNSW